VSLIKLLIAEDDEANAEIQKRFVERIEGIEVVGLARTCRDVAEYADVCNPDLVLLDVNFPDGSGLDLLRGWRAEDRDLDVILVTAASEVKTLKEALRAGVFDYILKPLVFERLAEALETYKQHLGKLEDMNALGQNDLDQFMAASASDRSKQLGVPKGIDLVTLEKVKQLMQSGTSVSAEEAAKELGVSRSTARRYLEYLISCGQLKVDLDYGQVGRPERRYIVLDTP